MKFKIEKSSEISKEEKISKQYDNTGKEEEVNEKESLVDQWVWSGIWLKKRGIIKYHTDFNDTPLVGKVLASEPFFI